MPVAYSGRESCPDTCRLKNNGCYAMQGPMSRVWDKITRGELGAVRLLELCRQVDELIGPRRLWRFGVAGDLPGIGDLIAPNDMERLVIANHRRPVIAYTHKPVLDHPMAKTNREIIKDAAFCGFPVNLSADSVAEADRLADLQLAPVVTVLPVLYGRRRLKKGGYAETIAQYRDRLETLPTRTPGGRRIAVCPATYSATTCDQCRACARPREAIIGFPAHGSQAKKAELAHLAARGVGVGWPWTFKEPEAA